MSARLYEGDPKLILDEEGANLVFRGGQCVMDRGLENAAMISILTEEGWWGNTLIRKPEQKIGSKFILMSKRSITVTSLNDLRSSILAALQWMVDESIASEIDAAITNPEHRQVNFAVLIRPPVGDPMVLLLSKNGQNWFSQKLDPAHLRI